MPKGVVLCGQKFGRLSVGPRGPNTKWGSHQWVCKCDCGDFVLVSTSDLLSGNTKSCGCLNTEMSSVRMSTRMKERTGLRGFAWKGGRRKAGHGYIEVWEPGHPNAQRTGYVREHVKIMGQILGRPLSKIEIVHHKNGIREDNRPENLELCVRSTHFIGQRVEDLVSYAVTILTAYAPELLKPKPHVSHTHTHTHTHISQRT